MSTTHDYYEENAEEFFESTVGAETEYLYKDFLELIPPHGRILDLGCGAGRDSRNFIERGYEVVSVDASTTLALLAKQKLGIDVICKTFDEIDYSEEFDGVWACASLLHCDKAKLPDIIAKVRDALIPGGVFYASFKYGEFEGERDGRFFLDLNEESVVEVFSRVSGLAIKKVWESVDVRRDCDVKWINIVAEKN